MEGGWVGQWVEGYIDFLNEQIYELVNSAPDNYRKLLPELNIFTRVQQKLPDLNCLIN